MSGCHSWMCKRWMTSLHMVSLLHSDQQVPIWPAVHVGSATNLGWLPKTCVQFCGQSCGSVVVWSVPSSVVVKSCGQPRVPPAMLVVWKLIVHTSHTSF